MEKDLRDVLKAQSGREYPIKLLSFSAVILLIPANIRCAVKLLQNNHFGHRG